jgi:hypothetical protein
MDSTHRTPFRTLCRCLTGALGQTLTAADLPASPAEWEKVLRLASSHLVTPQLRWALREQGLFADLPPEVAEFLEAIYVINLERNQECEDQLAQLIRVLNSIGVQPVLLKGFAAIVGGLYPTSGERIVTDIDILIPVTRLPEILDLLAGIGYKPIDCYQDLAKKGEWEVLCHHYPPIFSPDWPVTVELHVQPVDLPFVPLLSDEQVFSSAQTMEWRGGVCLLPSSTNFVIHNIIHSMLVNTQGKLERVSVRQLFEFALANREYGERIGWQAIASIFDDHDYLKSLRQYRAINNDCMNMEIWPEGGTDGWDRWRALPHLTRLELNNQMVERTIRALGQIKIRMTNLKRKPKNVKKLFTSGFYSRLFND